MDELPEPTPEAIKKAKRYYWTAYFVAALGFTALWSVAIISGKTGMLGPYLGPLADFCRRANPVCGIMPLAAGVATLVCRRSKTSLEVRARELIYLHRSERSDTQSPLTVHSEKTFAYLGMGFGLFFAVAATLIYSLDTSKASTAFVLSGVVSGLGALWSFAAWRWGDWNVATVDSEGIVLFKNRPWMFRKRMPIRLPWQEIDAIEVGRTRNSLGAESVGWINVWDKRMNAWQQLPQGAILPAKWAEFRERVRTEARRENPTEIAVARTSTVVGTPTHAEPEPLILQQRYAVVAVRDTYSLP